MLSIQAIVDGLLSESPLVARLIGSDLINITQLARSHKETIEEKAKKDCSIEAISMAVRRSQIPIRLHSNRSQIQISSIHMRRNLCELTYARTPSISRLIANKSISTHILTLTQGIGEVMILCEQKYTSEVKNTFANETLISEEIELASITLTLPHSNTTSIGLYANILSQIAIQGVNIIDMVSTPDELTIIINNLDTSSTLELFSRMRLEG